MDLLKIARVPPVTIGSSATVLDAVKRMSDTNAGAVVIVDDDQARGIFTASDLLRRVVAKGRRLETTRLSEVATFPLTVAQADTECEAALRLMIENHIRHLPIVDQNNRVRGVLSTRHLLRNMIDDMSQELTSLCSYFTADGIGG